MKKILGIGNALCDVLTQVDESVLTDLGLPKGSTQFTDLEGYKSLAARLETFNTTFAAGGSVGNTMRALANLGGKPGFIGKIGNDRYGEFYRQDFEALGGVPHFLVGQLPTGVAATFITPDGQRSFYDYLGAAATLTADELRPEWFDDADIFYIEGYLVQNHDVIMRAAEIAKEKNLLVVLDFGSYNIVASERDFFRQLLQKVDIIFANKDEALTFSGLNDPVAALSLLAETCQVAVVKVGRDGAMAKSGNDFAHMVAENVVRVVDSTGAGDYFAAGFLYGFSKGESLSACLRKGGILAAQVIQVVGTSLPATMWDDIKRRL